MLFATEHVGAARIHTVGQDGESPNGSNGVTKVAVANPHKPDYSGVFNWGLKVSNVDELFFVSGVAATDVAGTVQYPGDATAQTDFILRHIDAFIKENGYRTTDIIRFEITVTKDVPPDHFPAILDRLAELITPWTPTYHQKIGQIERSDSASMSIGKVVAETSITNHAATA